MFGLMFGLMFDRVQKSFLLALALLFVFLVACERKEREQAGRSVPLNSVSSNVSANYSSVAGLTNVSEVAPRGPDSGPDGQALYMANCSACHQATGQGVPGAFPPLDASPYVTGDKLERLAAIMIYGLKGPITVKGVTYNSVMLPQGKTLNDKELAAVATYVRSAWSNKAGAVEPAVFEKVRKQWGEREQFTIQELGEEK